MTFYVFYLPLENLMSLKFSEGKLLKNKKKA